jgi:hypothetical protein
VVRPRPLRSAGDHRGPPATTRARGVATVASPRPLRSAGDHRGLPRPPRPAGERGRAAPTVHPGPASPVRSPARGYDGRRRRCRSATVGPPRSLSAPRVSHGIDTTRVPAVVPSPDAHFTASLPGVRSQHGVQRRLPPVDHDKPEPQCGGCHHRRDGGEPTQATPAKTPRPGSDPTAKAAGPGRYPLVKAARPGRYPLVKAARPGRYPLVKAAHRRSSPPAKGRMPRWSWLRDGRAEGSPTPAGATSLSVPAGVWRGRSRGTIPGTAPFRLRRT